MNLKPTIIPGARVIALASLGGAVMLALGAGDAPDYPPLDLKPGAHVTEEGFCQDYLDWIAFRTGLERFDDTYGKRLEEARFAVRQHLAYLEEQPFLSTVAEAYRGYLKDLDTVQERVQRWRATVGADAPPNLAEAVEGFVRKTVYAEGEAMSPEVVETNYFARRMMADMRLPGAQTARNRNGMLECYDLYVSAASAVPPGKAYEAFRVDVLRKAMASGRQVFLLGGDKADRGFAQSVNPDDARDFVRLCVTLRALSPVDTDGEVKAAAAIGKWGAGDLRGAYEEALPVVALRRTDGAFAVFCARLASASGRPDDAVKWLSQALRGDPADFPAVALLRANPDFAAVRGKAAEAFGTLVARLETLENLTAVAAAARTLAGGKASLETCKNLHARLGGVESPILQAHLIATTVLGLRLNGKDAGVAGMEANLAALGPPEALRERMTPEALMDSCATCNGTGVDLAQNRRCAKCAGSGTCGFEYCRKGIRFSPFDRGAGGRPPVRQKCGDCKGSGICRYCKGKGKFPCPACEGGGKAFSKARITVNLRAVASETAELAERERDAYVEKVRLLPVR